VEIVIVCPSAASLEADEQALAGFASVVVKEVGAAPTLDRAGDRCPCSDGPVIFLGETHSFPHPGFAAAIVDTREPWDVVVPLRQRQPGRSAELASFLTDYGYWLHHLPAGQVGFAPTWNVAYKKEALLELGDSMGAALTGGDAMSTTLRASGRTIYLHPTARLDHANCSRTVKGWMDERYLTGLIIGSSRKHRWSTSRRWAYVLAS
jgi:hypothetical protein